MIIKVWSPEMSDKETKDLAYWERNMLALHYADGWYYDTDGQGVPRYKGWCRVLTLERGKITFHIPDDFEVGDLPMLDLGNWDGHTTEEKWRRIAQDNGVEVE